jgi:hypothetical protein
MSWEAKQDVLKLKGKLEPPERITMRAIISTISKIYDPLGMADPVTITGRMIGQSLWGFVKTLKTDWDMVLDNREDEEVQAVMREWEKHFIQLTQLSQLEMSRALTDGSQKSFTIHIFGDGSKLAYAAVAYIRVVYNDRVEVKFICAKKKNVPLKGRTIPQIELMAATIVTRLGTYLQLVYKETESIHYWSDSLCVLKWINNHERRYITFVRSRITEIHDATKGLNWRHCPTGDNPADLPTRGLTVAQLKDATVWWHGPHWLVEEEHKWPKLVDQMNPDETRCFDDAIDKLSFTPNVCPKPAKRKIESTTLNVCTDNNESLILGGEDDWPHLYEKNTLSGV